VAVNDEYDFILSECPKKQGEYILEESASEGVLANDSDADGDSLTAILVTTPPRGKLEFRSDGSFTCRIGDLHDTTTVSFTYKANDGELDSNTATVTLTIKPKR